MKNLILIFLLLFYFTPVYAQIITGEVKYDTDLAKNEIFNYPRLFPDKSITISHLIDIEHNENYNCLLKGITKLTDRVLAKFSDNSYAVVYNKAPQDVFYYSQDGILIYHEVKSSVNYPNKAYKYNTNFKLINTTLNVSESESYIFKPDGNLIAHWINSKCFDKNGNVIRTRTIYK